MNITRHPSGRPTRKTETRGRQIWRVPDRGYVIPRLQDGPRVNAISFTVERLSGSDPDDWSDKAKRD